MWVLPKSGALQQQQTLVHSEPSLEPLAYVIYRTSWAGIWAKLEHSPSMSKALSSTLSSEKTKNKNNTLENKNKRTKATCTSLTCHTGCALCLDCSVLSLGTFTVSWGFPWSLRVPVSPRSFPPFPQPRAPVSPQVHTGQGGKASSPPLGCVHNIWRRLS